MILRRFRSLSLHWKIPLRVTGLVVLTAALITGAGIALEVRQTRQDLDRYAVSLGRVLARTVMPHLLHDDVWRSFEIARTTIEEAGLANPPAAQAVIVADATGSVFVASDPRRFPVGSAITELDAALALPDIEGVGASRGESRMIERPADDRILFAEPIIADGVPLGQVVLVFSKSSFLPRYLSVAKRGLVGTTLVVLLLAPAAWWWARRTGAPLVELASAMSKVPDRLEEAASTQLKDTGDEIGDLSRTFRAMLRDLQRHKDLESQMLSSERLAAIGRLTAAIAHEINNPLGGMLNAISTYRRHGSEDPLALRTLSMLERGLSQIRSTVGALLVETRSSHRPLGPHDIEDVRLLVSPEIEVKSGRLDIEQNLVVPVSIPAQAARQILLNLLLNAAHAIHTGGRIFTKVDLQQDRLRIVVQNDGNNIEPEKLQYLFEPFTLSSSGGYGLGLWVVYQIVRDLGGTIDVQSVPGDTRFEVVIALGGAMAKAA